MIFKFIPAIARNFVTGRFEGGKQLKKWLVADCPS
jgi:hypothetical protein